MFTNITTLLGGNGNNTFIGLDAEATFALGENAAYSSSGRTLNFSGFTTLIGGRLADRFEIQGECTYELKGGDGDDIFVFYNNARLNGSIDGGKGRNTLDYSRYSSVRNIILTAVTVLEGTGEGDGAEETGEAGEAGETGDAGVIVGSFAGREAETISVGFTNISEFIGSNRNGDVIKGLNEKSTWQLNGNTVIYRDVLLTLTGIEIIAGSEQGDSFVINGRVLYSLQGGSGDDSFTFSDGAVLQGRINGGLGTDELDFSAYLSASNVTLTAADEQGFAGTQAAITAGFAGIDKIKGSLTAENTLRGLNEASIYRFTATEYSVTVAGHTLVFANYHHLIAGSADDTFIFEGTGHLAGSLDGGLGQNTLDYSAYELGDNSGVTVNLLTGSATGVADGEADRVRNISRLIGSKYNDILIGNNQDNVFDGGAGDDYLAGNGGNNTFFFKENWGKDIVINASGLGTLDFTAITADLRIDLAQAIISDLTNVSGSDCVNLVEFSGIKVIKGGSGDDTFIVSSAGENRYDLYGHDGNDTFVFSGNGSLEGLVDGGAGYNTLDYSTYDSEVVFNLEKLTATGLVRFSQIHRIIGSNHNDTIIGLNTNTTYKITAENAGQIIPEIADSFTGIDFAAVENLTGGSLDDTFAFIGNGYLTGLIDGGKGQNTLDYSAYDHGDGSGVVVDLNTGSATAVNNGEAGGIKNIQNLVSSPYKDVFIDHEKANNTFIFTDNWNADTIFLGGEQNLLDFSRVQEIMRILLKSDGIYIEAGESQIAFTGENVLGGNIYNAFAKILGGQGGVTFEIQANYCTALYGGAGDDTFRLADGVTYDGLLDGQGGRNTLDYSAYSAPREIRLTGLGAQGGFNGRDELLAKGFANIHRIIGTGRGDSLYGLADSAGTFELGGPNTGSDDGIYVSGGQTLFFSGFAKLYGGKDNDTFRIFGEQVYDLFGGAGNDTFIFADNAKLRGVIDGEAGHNTLDYAAYTTTRNFYLTGKGSLAGFDGKEASIDGMFRNITALIGGEAIDSLSGLDSDSVWRINGRNSGTYTTDNRTISFSFIDTLLGGAKSDRFCFQDKGSLDGNVDGRSGTDTLDYSACLEGIYVNLLTDKASKIRGGISSIENVSGGSGDDEIIGDDKDNLLDGGAGNDKLSGGAGNDELRGGSGNDWLDGGEGDDVLYSGSGHNTLIGGAGYDRVIIAYGSTYHYPQGDIEHWTFLKPPPKDPEKPERPVSGGGGGVFFPQHRFSINRELGGIIASQGVVIIIPALVLPDNAVITVTKLAEKELIALGLLTEETVNSLTSEIYEITTSGESEFGDTNFIKIRIPFALRNIAPGEIAVIHYYDPLLGKWIPLKTEVEYDEKTGQPYAVVKVNHLTKFAVFSTEFKVKVIRLKIGESTALIDGSNYLLTGTPFIEESVGRTMVPLRFISEAIGAEVEWIQATQQVIISKDEQRIVLTIGSKEVLVNKEKQMLDTAPLLKTPGITYVPLRFLCEALETKVNYNGITREITITYNFYL